MAKGKYEYWISPEGLLKIEDWARMGLTNEQKAHNMGITRETLNQWSKKYSDISDTLKRGKDVVDIEVENKLLKRALGYRYTETTKERVFNPKTEKAEFVVTKEIEKEVVPDTTAQIFWLKNRRPDRWKDKQEVAVDARLEEEKNKLDDLLRQIKEK